MKKEELNLIRDPVDLEILSHIDGKRNITDISAITKYTYKSVFHRIKKMEKVGWITLTKTTDITQGAILNISSNIKNTIEHEIRSYQLAGMKYKEIIRKDPSSKEDVKQILSFINNNRLVSEHDIDAFIWDKYQFLTPKWSDVGLLRDSLVRLGCLRSRIEITRSGKKLLNELNKK